MIRKKTKDLSDNTKKRVELRGRKEKEKNKRANSSWKKIMEEAKKK